MSSRAFIVAGIALIVIGLWWPWLSKLPWGRLPGDIFVEQEGFCFYAPLATSVLLSVLFSLLYWILQRLS